MKMCEKKKMSKKKIDRIAEWSEIFGKNLSDRAITLYVESLREIPDVWFDMVAEKALKKSQFMPMPGLLWEIWEDWFENRMFDPEYRKRCRAVENYLADAHGWVEGRSTCSQERFEEAMSHLGFSEGEVFLIDI